MVDAYIFEALRTPRGTGKQSGSLHQVRAIELLTTVLNELRERHQLDTSQVDDGIFGCVTPVEDQGGNIAKAALLFADWDNSVGGMQINRFCCSGLDAVNLATMKIRSGFEDLIVAGGVESMSRVPIHHDDGPILYDPDVVDKDEHVRTDTSLEALAALSTSFTEMGESGFDAMALKKYPMIEKVLHVHTAGNSSGIVDGAAVVLIGNLEKSKQLNLNPRARVVATATVSTEPTIMLTGHIAAAKKVLKKAGLTKKDIDLWEVNEAFASVALKFQKDMDIEDSIMNVNGGAIALGHPLGATGAMMLGTVLDELERRNMKRALITLCGGAGMGVATIIERV
ncbi:hypothetical protein GHT06_007582 [Daphnia sinensis]|uniref:Acetyl-CoA C-acetyltransferase n=1 Tax=Daphnia sinensis TaxID=1820382 RepID=A0AAD5KDZ5_9CRUS|nr:hypothetical protein GHT06_007582 [Daphnia sinensis]